MPPAASATGFYLSTNTTSGRRRRVPWQPAGAAAGRGCGHAAASTTLRIPASTATGSYYVLAKGDWDGQVPESTETNNVRATGQIKIGPDLAVSALDGARAARRPAARSACRTRR